MSIMNNLGEYEVEVKRRMRAILSAARMTHAKAAERMGYTPSTFSRYLNPDGGINLSFDFCIKFASTFCEGNISKLLDSEKGNDDVVAYGFNMQRVFHGLPDDIMQGIYDRAVSEGDAFRELLKKKVR